MQVPVDSSPGTRCKMEFKVLSRELVYPLQTVELEPTPVLDDTGEQIYKTEVVYDEKGNVVYDEVPVTERINGVNVPKVIRVVVPNPDDPGVIHLDVPVMRKVTRTQEVPLMQREYEAVPNEDEVPDGMKFVVEAWDKDYPDDKITLDFTMGKATLLNVPEEARLALLSREVDALYLKQKDKASTPDWTAGLPTVSV